MGTPVSAFMGWGFSKPIWVAVGLGLVVPTGVVGGALVSGDGFLMSQSSSASLRACRSCVLRGSRVSSLLPMAITGSGP